MADKCGDCKHFIEETETPGVEAVCFQETPKYTGSEEEPRPRVFAARTPCNNFIKRLPEPPE